MIRLLLSALVGVALGGLATHLLTGDPRYAIVWGLALPFVVGGLIIVGIVGSIGPMRRANSATIDAARYAGRVHPARLDRITSTRIQINDEPVCLLDLTVATKDRGTYRTQLRQPVSLIDIPRLQPGARLSVARIREDAPNVAIVEDRVPHLETLVSRMPPAEHVTTWEVDPQDRSRPLVSTGKHGCGLRIVAYVLLAAVGFGLGSINAHDELLLAAQSISGENRRDYLRSTERIEKAVAELGESAGVDQATQVLFYPYMAKGTMPTEAGARTFDDYTARYGRVTHDGPTTIQPSDPGAEIFDLDEVNWAAIPELARQALDEVGATGSDIHVHADVSRTSIEAEDGGHPIQISIYVGGDYGSGRLVADADGNVLEVDPAD